MKQFTNYKGGLCFYWIFIVLWRPAAALSVTSNAIQDCASTRSEICFYCVGAGGLQHVSSGLPVALMP